MNNRKIYGTPSPATLVMLGAAVAAALAVGSVASRVLRIVERPSWPPPQNAVTAEGAQVETGRLIATSPRPRDIGMDFAWSTATSIDPWPEGKEFFPRILADLRTATSSIHILMFGWKEGDVSDEFALLIKEKLSEGVDVRILVDGFGSRPYGASKDLFESLSEAGAAIVVNDLLPPEHDGLYPNRRLRKPSREFGRAEHRKLYIVDGDLMWTGGAGIEDHFRNGKFHDVMVRLTGDIVRQAQAVFLTSFVSHGGLAPEELGQFFPAPSAEAKLPEATKRPASPIPVALVQVVPGGFVSATQAARSLITSAVDRLDIMNPYLTDPGMIDLIIKASGRGVQVRIVLSAKSNNFMATAATKHRYAEMIEAGVNIWEYPDAVVHTKLIISDDTVMFGTLNLDAWALYRDFEFAIVATDSELCEVFEARIVNPDIALCEAGHTSFGQSQKLINTVADKLTYFL